jgi:hypothetical protein
VCVRTGNSNDGECSRTKRRCLRLSALRLYLHITHAITPTARHRQYTIVMNNGWDATCVTENTHSVSFAGMLLRYE